MDVLLPYLDDYWRSYIDDATSRLADLAYPPGAATTGGPAPATYEELAPVLADAAPRRAVLSCLVVDRVHRNPHYAATVATAVNEWLRDEWLGRDERLRANLVVSTLDIPAAVREVERLADDERFAGVLLPVRSDVPYGNRLYHPLYEAAERHGLRIAIHAWGRAGAAPTTTGLATTYLEDYLSNAHLAEVQLLSLVAEGVFGRFPDPGVVFAECGFAWLPSLLWRFDKDWKAVWREVPWVKRQPSEYVRRHVRLTTAPAQLPTDPAVLARIPDLMPVTEMLLYASDHPHRHGGGIEPLLDVLDDAGRRAILAGNAAALYGLGPRWRNIRVLPQPCDLPERLLAGDPEGFYFASRRDLFAPEALAEYERCLRDPRVIHAICEDYRAGATLDVAHDEADRGARRIACPVLVLWGEAGPLGRLDPMAVWARWADDVRGAALPCGHHLPEEAPAETHAALRAFLSPA